MKTIFLASGRSSRMAPISDKSLLTFCGKPLCIHLLQNAKKAGLTDFIVVTNHTNEAPIQKHLKDFEISAQTIQQPNLDEGMAGGIEAGLTLVQDNEPVLILGGNDYVENSAYKNVLKTLKTVSGALLAKKVKSYFPGGYLNIDESGKVVSIVEKPGAGNEPSDLVNIVVHGFQQAGVIKNALKQIPKDTGDAYEKALSSLFQTQTIKAVDYQGVWQAIKYPWHILDMMDILLNNVISTEIVKREEGYDTYPNLVFVDPTVKMADTAKIRGEHVVIDAGTVIHDNAVIQGPCYIGENCIIGNNTLVRNSHIGNSSTVGYNTEVARSYLHKDVTTHMAYVGDSIVDKGVNFGAFSTTANLRLDKNHVKVNINEERITSEKEKLGAIIGADAQIGIHALLMPGCKIDPQKLVLPGSTEK